MKKEIFQTSELSWAIVTLKEKSGESFDMPVIIHKANNSIIASAENLEECSFEDIFNIVDFDRILEDLDLSPLPKKDYTADEIQQLLNTIINIQKVTENQDNFWSNIRIRIIVEWWTLEIEALLKARSTKLAQKVKDFREYFTVEMRLLFYSNPTSNIIIEANHPCLLKALENAKIDIAIPEDWRVSLEKANIMAVKGEDIIPLCINQQITNNDVVAEAIFYECRLRRSDLNRYGYNGYVKIFNNIRFNEIRIMQYRYFISCLVEQRRKILEGENFYYQDDLNPISNIKEFQATRTINHVYLLGVLAGACKIRDNPNNQEQGPNMEGTGPHYYN